MVNWYTCMNVHPNWLFHYDVTKLCKLIFCIWWLRPVTIMVTYQVSVKSVENCSSYDQLKFVPTDWLICYDVIIVCKFMYILSKAFDHYSHLPSFSHSPKLFELWSIVRAMINWNLCLLNGCLTMTSLIYVNLCKPLTSMATYQISIKSVKNCLSYHPCVIDQWLAISVGPM